MKALADVSDESSCPRLQMAIFSLYPHLAERKSLFSYLFWKGPNYLPKSPPPNTIALGVRILSYGLGGWGQNYPVHNILHLKVRVELAHSSPIALLLCSWSNWDDSGLTIQALGTRCWPPAWSQRTASGASFRLHTWHPPAQVEVISVSMSTWRATSH